MSPREDEDLDPTAVEDVVAAIDRSMDEPQFVIADVSTDGVWIATPAADAISLEAYR